ncbi:MAG TPA: DUF5715 family protein [Streptosporangiaceae bacterium]|nr:DUF5715 family protein [Streptosporangiaceae bacterium]
MTGWLLKGEPTADDLSAGAARRLSDVAAYREAVADLLAELAGPRGEGPRAATAERVLTSRLSEPEFMMIFSATPSGPEAAARRVLREVRSYQQNVRSSAGNLTAMIRIALLSQIDLLWWGHLPAYQSDGDVRAATDLLDLDVLRRDGKLLFRYRRQASTLLARAARSAERKAAPGRVPMTAGLRFACARPQLVVLLNQIAADFAGLAPPGTPRLWVTSLTRSVSHQLHLRDLGYAALLPSAHCTGYAADIEMTWFRQFEAEEALQQVLLERQLAGEVNVIDEGQAWHICIRPGAGRALRLIPEQQKGS